MTNTASPALLTVAEVATILRLSPSALYRMLEAGEIRGVRVTARPGASWRIPATELDRILSPLSEEH